VSVPQEADRAPADWRSAGDRIDTLINASASGGSVARERAEELVRLVVDLYGAGLERVLDIMYEHGRLDDNVLEALAEDDLVASLLLVHGLHPYDVATRVGRALDGVRPYLGSHGGDVELLGVSDDGVVRLRMLGTCDGCPSSSVTLKLAVEGAIEAAAPEITAIEVDEATGPAAGTANGATIPVQSLFVRVGESGPSDHNPHDRQDGGTTWLEVPALESLSPGAVTNVVVGATAVVACRIGGDRFAFRDECARCGRSLHGAVLARRLGGAVGDAVLRCPGCRAHYDVRRAGAGLDDETLHLDPLPLLADGIRVSVAVPAPVSA
jgi:Fe-S cluster biogenesis protein NfuA/nitrite reductase/ring-hydroxylating ferredoxin subunit